MKKSLLEKAKETSHLNPRKIDITADDLEVALAWVRGEVTLTQVTLGYGFDRKHVTQTYVRIARSLRVYINSLNK